MTVQVVSSNLLLCPHCLALLAKARTFGQGRRLAVFRHRGAHLVFRDAVVTCRKCGKDWLVDAASLTVKEAMIGHETGTT